MKTKLLSLAAGLALLCGQRAFTQDKKPGDSAEKSKSGSIQASTNYTKPTSEELEAKFKATLTKATMAGRWCSVKDGQLGPDKQDKYIINSVTKLSGETWLIQARIQYNNKDFVAPIPVQVKWAGDTPVITIDNIPIPGSGTYSARVLIYEHTYAGTWSGGDHVGLLNGAISNEKE